jgi:[ribosomal protein S5]-alanine N-acetyltransferase
MKPSIHLRAYRIEDAAQLALIANNKKIWKNLRDHFPHPYTVHDAIQWINHTSAQKPVINMAISVDGKLAGGIGVVPKDDVYRKTIEIGYFLGEAYWNKGIATASVSLLLDYIRQQFDVVRIYAEVFESNAASMRVLEKNGFHLECIRQKAVIKNNVIMNDHVYVKLV